MPGTLIHLAIADNIYNILGSDVIKNPPLFFGGNIAPDAIHAKKDFQRADKIHTHLCDGIRSYGYGYPDVVKIFMDRVNEFIEKYYLTAGEDKDLYLGYAVHLLADKFEMFSACERLANQLGNEVNANEPEYQRKLADEVNAGNYRNFFKEDGQSFGFYAHEYEFKNNVVNILEAVWDYEIKDYICSDEINISKRWYINTVFKREVNQSNILTYDHNIFIQYIDISTKKIIEQLQCIL
ncbi:MAG: zinc dependent phospholipase C family protein [Eubacteriales bacterium]|nr:zinc dependent phospholipase C family protein [Eubacteriales bacterium]